MARSRRGFSRLGIRKPDYWKPSSGTLFYNLADQQQLKALLNTLRHLTAYAAGLRNSPNTNRYYLRNGQRRRLVETPIPPTQKSRVKYDESFECVEVHRENRNYRNPGHKVFARDPEIRARATAAWRRDCRTLPTYTFKVTRKLRHALGYEDRVDSIVGTDSLMIPADAAIKVVAAVQDLLLWLWSYMGRHPEQSERRALPWNARWQLHHPPAFDWLIPRLHDACLQKEEPALFEHPELYRKIRRYKDENAESCLEKFTPEYIARLQAYDRGELQWRGHWEPDEFQAQTDLRALNLEVNTLVKLRTKYCLRLMALMTLIRKRQPRGSTQEHLPIPSRDEPYQEEIEIAAGRIRGPPRRARRNRLKKIWH